SDSDMPSFGFGFKPWTHQKAIAQANVICDYLQETIQENKINAHINYGYKVNKAEFSSDEQLWTITAENLASKALVNFKARF
ncbi:FAD-containing monooxygenase EthA, partial [Acinetobacter baumannii]|nr:FAD-containing monooxygenase EthA [Acinetobacter baumannii]